MDIRLAGFHSPPFTVLSKQNDGRVEDIGLLQDLIKILSKQLNISCEIKESKEGYGNQDKNNKWNGIIGMLTRNESDMAISLLSMNEERSQVITFSPRLIVTPHIIVTSSGIPLERHITDHLLAIDYTFWLLLFGTIFTFNLFYFMYQNVNYRAFTIQIWTFVAILFNQYNSRSRLTYYTFVVSVLILNYSLICFFLNSLIGVEIVINSDKHAIESLSDLAKAKSVIPSLDSGSSILSIFAKSTLNSNAEIWRRIDKNRKFSMVPYNSQYNNPLRDMIIDGKVAVIKLLIDAWLLKIGFCKMNPKWKLHFAAERITTTTMSLGYRKGLGDNIMFHINKIINLVVSNGLMNKWIDDMYRNFSRSNSCEVNSCIYDSNKQDFNNFITLNNTKTLLHFALLAILFAALVLYLEIIINLCKFNLISSGCRSINNYKQSLSNKKH